MNAQSPEPRNPPEPFPDLADRITAREDLMMSERLRKAETIGRPIGSAALVPDLETRSGRRLLSGKPGTQPKGCE
jgi:putative transposase